MIGWLIAKLNFREKRGPYLQRKIGVPLHLAVLLAWPFGWRVGLWAYVAAALALTVGGKVQWVRSRRGPFNARDLGADLWIAAGGVPPLLGWSRVAQLLFAVWLAGVYVIYRLDLTDEIEAAEMAVQ